VIGRRSRRGGSVEDQLPETGEHPALNQQSQITNHQPIKDLKSQIRNQTSPIDAMRILSITAGAAGMYCGSCFRDNALARELMARQHDVTLMPVYTPTRTDEANVSRRDVLFGGISVYLQQYSSIFRKTPRFLDRLWDSPRVIGAFLLRCSLPFLNSWSALDRFTTASPA
jgi:hypothetical protein